MMAISNASLKFFKALSIRVIGKALFFDRTKVNTISFWLHLTNLTFDLILSTISERKRQAEFFR